MIKRFGGIVTIFLIIVLCLIAYAKIITNIVDEPGTFGDMFGGATALFSGLAFAGMIYAIVLQSNELALQRDELRLTREELVATRGEQTRAANAQQELVEKQLLTARIRGMSAIVQGRYSYVSAHGANSHRHLNVVKDAEDLLIQYINEAGAEDIKMTDIV